MPVVAYAEEDEETSVFDGVDLTSLPVISCNESIAVSFETAGAHHIAAFTPTETGEYIFYSSGENDTLGYIYDSDLNELAYNDDNAYLEDEDDFAIKYDLEADKTYYLVSAFFDSVAVITESYYISVIQAAEPTAISFSQDSYGIYTGDSFMLPFAMEPWYSSSSIDYTYTSSSSEIVKVSEDGQNMAALKPGACEITITTENKLTDTCTVTVKDIPQITAGSSVTLSQSALYDFEYISFTPETDGTYVFYSSDADAYSDAYLYDDAYDELSSMTASNEVPLYLSAELESGMRYMILIDLEEDASLTLHADKQAASTGISLIQDTLKGYVGNMKQLSISWIPVYGTPESYTWTSSNKDVATVDEEGLVSLLSAGTATITVTSESGWKDTCTVTVNNKPIISVGESKSVVISTGDERASYLFTPEADDVYHFYSTSEDDLDTEGYIFDEDGNQIAYNDDDANSDGVQFSIYAKLEAGKCYELAAKFLNSTKTGSFSVHLEKAATVTSFSLDTKTLTGYAGFSRSLSYSYEPENAALTGLTWSSSNEDVATVDEEGVVSFVSAGTATITAALNDDLQDTCTVTVMEPAKISTGSKATVNIASKDTSVVFEFTAPKDGFYRFYSVSDETLDLNPRGYLYAPDGEYTYNDDADANTLDFSMKTQLNAGETCLIECKLIDPDTGSYDVYVEEIQLATKIAFAQDTYTVYETKRILPEIVPQPENSWVGEYTYSIADEDIALIDDNRILGVAQGTTTLTATTDSGLTATCTIVVKTFDSLVLDQKNTFSAKGEEEVSFSYTPEETATYVFYSENTNFFDASLFENGEELTGVYNNGLDGNFKLACELEAGTKYIFSCCNMTNSDNDLTVTLSKAVPATSLQLSQDTFTGYPNTSVLLKATTLPLNSNENITWQVADKTIAEIKYTPSGSCMISCLKAGTTTVTATSENGLTASCTLTVMSVPEMKVNGSHTVRLTESLRQAAVTFTPTESGSYTFTVSGNGITYAELYFEGHLTSSWGASEQNPNASLTYNLSAGSPYTYYFGFISGLNTGDITVTLTKNSGTPVVNNTSISLKSSSATLYLKKTTAIAATVVNGKGTTTYVSSKPSVATVDANGIVTAKKKGTAVITVTNNGVQKTFTVTVKNPTVKAKKKTIKVGKTTKIKVKNGVGKAKFKALNKIAKVNSKGKVTGLKKGKAKIQVKVSGKKFVVKIKVK